MILRLLLAVLSQRFVSAQNWTSDFHLPVSWLDSVVETYPPGLGEPLNVVLSARSSSAVLARSTFEDYLKSVGYADECLGLSAGHKQSADLADGKGMKEQANLYRWAYGLVQHGGTCYESLNGGSHLRYWFQETTGAVFMAVSNEHNATLNHGIVENGYDLGRDTFLGNATILGGTTSPSTGARFLTTSVLIPGFIQPGWEGINHFIPVDGNIALIAVTTLDDEGGARTSVWPAIGSSLGASLLALVLSFVALRPSRKGAFSTTAQVNSHDVHSRRHEQLLLALEQVHRGHEEVMARWEGDERMRGSTRVAEQP